MVAIVISGLACFLVGLLFTKYVLMKKKQLPKNLNKSNLNYGTIKRYVKYKDYTTFTYSGETRHKTVTAKVKFKEFLGTSKVKVEYLELLNGDNHKIVKTLNTYHDMVDYYDVEWIEDNHNTDLVLSKRDLFSLLNGTRIRKKGEVVTFEEGVNTSDLLDYIANKKY